MTDEKRCEPPPKMRLETWMGEFAAAAQKAGWRVEVDLVSADTSATPPATVAALVEALEESEKMLDYVSTSCRQWAVASRIGGWSTHQVAANIALAENAESSLGCVRAALALYRKENGR